MSSAMAAAALLLGSSAALHARAQSLEHAVKATFLYKFAGFVEWPPESFDSPERPLALCVAGNNAVTALAEEAARGQTLRARAITVRKLTQPAQAAGCHILYVGGMRGDAIAAYLQQVRAEPVLTVTDDGDDRRTKGTINFVLRDGRVRFEIDVDSAQRHGIALSSKLASLAVNAAPAR